jgi:hypothetical protein
MSLQDLKDEIAELKVELASANYELETYERVIGDDTVLHDEIKLLREFIEDVRLGIRDLDEYGAVCNPAYI